MEPRIFVSYTREAGPADARRLVGDLRSQLRSQNVHGADEQRPEQATYELIGSSDLVVAVIGPGWQGADDAFAQEVGAALRRRIPVIDVLTGDAVVPSRSSLPDQLKPLLDHHPSLTVEIPSDFYWDVSAARLARWLTRIAKETERRNKAKQDAAAARAKLERELERQRRMVAEAETSARAWASRQGELDRAVHAASETLVATQSGVDPARSGGMRVFLSYGPETSGDARTLEDDLKERLPQAVIYSTDPIPEGADPAQTINERIGRCDVVLAVIGREWTLGPGQPRLEVQEALRRGLPVIPVLTQHAGAPDRKQLPDGLTALADLPALELLVQFWSEGVDALVARLRTSEQELQRRRKALDDATDELHRLQREANKAREEHDRAAAAIDRGRVKIVELEQRLGQARDEEERLMQEREDQNRAFLDGPPEIEPQAPGTKRPSGLLIAAGIAILVIVIIIALVH